MNAPFKQQPPNPARLAEDLGWGLRHAILETLDRAQFHLENVLRYYAVGDDGRADDQHGQMVQCLKEYSRCRAELAATKENVGGK